MSIEDWYKGTVGDDTPNAVAENSGIVVSSLWRQLPDKISPSNIVKIAHAYGVPALDGLVAIGLISDDDVAHLMSDDALRNASDEQLINELTRRLAERHDEIVSDDDSIWNRPMEFEAAAKRDPLKKVSKGTDEEFAD